MTPKIRLRIKVWVTAAFTLSLACVIAGLGVFAYWRTGADLLATIDAGLRSRAEILAASVQRGEPVPPVQPTLIESDEVIEQITYPSGRIIDSSPVLAGHRMVPVQQARLAVRSEVVDRRLPGIDNLARVLLVPVPTAHGRLIVIVGASLQDRRNEMTQLAATLAISGAAAVCLLGAGSWLAMAAALRPVEQMRRQAAGISETGAGSRLALPAGGGEITRLGHTLNRMLDRIEGSVERERRLIDSTSHELRTPLAIQRMDLDLALSGEQTAGDLAAALSSVSEENERLSRLTDDLLVLARARGGALAVKLTDVTLPDLLADARDEIAAITRSAAAAAVTFAATDARVRVDRLWFRQAITNLVDNALRHTPADGQVDVRLGSRDGVVTLVVQDTGRGFDDEFLARAFEPFARGGWAQSDSGSTGLGLAIVQAIAEAHHGRAWAENRPSGGSRVTMAVSDGLAGP